MSYDSFNSAENAQLQVHKTKENKVYFEKHACCSETDFQSQNRGRGKGQGRPTADNNNTACIRGPGCSAFAGRGDEINQAGVCVSHDERDLKTRFYHGTIVTDEPGAEPYYVPGFLRPDDSHVLCDTDELPEAHATLSAKFATAETAAVQKWHSS